MRSLSDHTDLLNRTARNIKSVAQHCSSNHDFCGPFTHAILTSHLGDLIRDVDPSELGLFTLVQPETTRTQEKHSAPPSAFEIERVNFSGANPLKRPNTRPEDTPRIRDTDPELYAEAALKYMDRYKLVRPMPRAQLQVQTILERAPIIRKSIEDLTDDLCNLEQAKTSEGPDAKAQLEEEEQHIKELRLKLAELTNKRSALIKSKKSHLDLTESGGSARKPLVASRPNIEGDDFWSTPSARTLKFSNNLLMDESVELGDISTLSFSASPATLKTTPILLTNALPDSGADTPENFKQIFRDQTPAFGQREVTPSGSPRALASSPPLISPGSGATNSSFTQSSSPSEHHILSHDVLEQQPSQDIRKISITGQVETIAAKIWAVMSDLVVVAATATRGFELHKKPSTRDMIDYLESMEHVKSIDSLSAITTNNSPSSQQVLTASLLIGLLSSPNDYSLPLSKVKELLAARGDNGVDSSLNPSQQNTSRIVYGCVAKRLLKIDRTGGEQIVKFDV